MIFLKRYPDILNPSECNHIIDTFDRVVSEGGGVKRQQSNSRDMRVAFDSMSSEANFRNTEIASLFFTRLSKCINSYTEELLMGGTILGRTPWFKDMIVQKTEADKFEAYSGWHCEAYDYLSSDRVLSYILYLNDDIDGGETEFLYQKHREEAVQGKLVIFPAGFTHTHRGGLLKSGSKYIATGWCFY